MAEEMQSLTRDTNGSLTETSAPEKQEMREEQMKKMFRIFDRDGNGYITAAELAGSMAKIGHPLTLLELNGMMNVADSNGDGKIDFAEFKRALSSSALLNSPFP